jgi:hypothetical protein
VVLAGLRMVIVVVLGLATIFLTIRPQLAPIPVLAGLLWAAVPLGRAWRGAEGTALLPAIAWAALTIAIALISQVIALTEPFETGRPGAGQVVYLSSLAAFATLISVLNARTPGGGAWAILMAMLVVVFLVPWLEGSGLAREGGGWDRLRLTPPWTIFYGLLVIAGVTNFAPTRFGSSALLLAIGFGIEYAGLTQLEWSHATRGRLWSAVPLCWASAAWLADVDSLRPPSAAPGLCRLWAWFRNGWGVVWALRVQERFNRTAELSHWPIRLTWHGVVNASGSWTDPVEIPPAARATLAGLLRRFATEDVLNCLGEDDS